MSRRADSSPSERIDRIPCRRPAEMRLERGAVDHIDRALEQVGDIILYADVIEDRDVRIGGEFDQYIDVALGSVIATGNRAEQGSMANAPGTQCGLRSTKDCQRVLHVHAPNIAETERSLTRIGSARIR